MKSQFLEKSSIGGRPKSREGDERFLEMFFAYNDDSMCTLPAKKSDNASAESET